MSAPPEHHLLRTLRTLDLPMGHWALFGSGPLLVRGWIDDVSDLDVVARGPAWDLARRLGDLVHLDEHDIDIAVVAGAITVGTAWAIGTVDVAAVIEDAEVIAGIPCARLEHVVAYKRIADRAKDRRHLAVIAGRGRSGA